MATEPTLQLTVLCEDARRDPRLVAEHGLSMLLETPRHRVLLDTGAGSAFLRNAGTMGVDLERLDGVVLSHGHYDHTGGLGALLEGTGAQRVVAHPLVFRRRSAPGKRRERRSIGPPLAESRYEALGAEFELTAEPFSWGDDVLTTGQVPEAFPDRRPGRLQVEIDGQVVPDDFADDISVVVRLAEGIVIVTGCAHAGLRNIVRRAVEVSGTGSIHAIVGGTHLIAYEAAEVRSFAAALNAAGVKALAPCHCTGARAIEELNKTFDGRVASLATGDVAQFSPQGEMTVAEWKPHAG